MTNGLERLAECCAKPVDDALTGRGAHHLVRTRAKTALSIVSDAIAQANALQSEAAPIGFVLPAKLLRELLRLHGLAGDATGLDDAWDNMTRQSAQEQNSAEPQSEEPGVPLGLQAARIVALTDCAQAYARGASRQRESAAQSRAQARGLLQSAAEWMR